MKARAVQDKMDWIRSGRPRSGFICQNTCVRLGLPSDSILWRHYRGDHVEKHDDLNPFCRAQSAHTASWYAQRACSLFYQSFFAENYGGTYVLT